MEQDQGLAGTRLGDVDSKPVRLDEAVLDPVDVGHLACAHRLER